MLGDMSGIEITKVDGCKRVVAHRVCQIGYGRRDEKRHARVRGAAHMEGIETSHTYIHHIHTYICARMHTHTHMHMPHIHAHTQHITSHRASPRDIVLHTFGPLTYIHASQPFHTYPHACTHYIQARIHTLHYTHHATSIHTCTPTIRNYDTQQSTHAWTHAWINACTCTHIPTPYTCTCMHACTTCIAYIPCIHACIPARIHAHTFMHDTPAD